MQLSEKDTPKNQKLQTNSKNEIFFQDVRHGGRHVGQHGGRQVGCQGARQGGPHESEQGG